MKKVMLFCLLIFAFSACHSQEKQKKNQNSPDSTASKEMPKGNWTVHKKYDDNGNLIAKDSTYSYSYSTINGKEMTDEQLEHFRQQMKKMRDSFGFNGQFPEEFKYLDSIQKLFGQDYSGEMGEIHQQMKQKMDSLRRHFFDQSPDQRMMPREKNQDEIHRDQSPEDSQVPTQRT